MKLPKEPVRWLDYTERALKILYMILTLLR